MLSKNRRERLKANEWKFYLLRILGGLSFAGPVFVLFLQDNGLSMTEVMILQSVFTLMIMLTVVPFGILTDYIGKKKILIANGLFITAAWTLYSLGDSFTDFLIAEIIFGMGIALWISASAPFLYDSLKELKQEGTFKRKYGKSAAIYQVTVAVASLVAGFVATYSLRLPYIMSAIPMFVAFIFCFSLTETKSYKHAEKHYLAHLKDAVKFSATHPKVRMFMLYSGIATGLMFTAYMMYQPYFQSIELPLAFFGAVYAAMSIVSAISAKYAHDIEEFLGERKILLLMAGAYVITYIGMSYVHALIGLAFPLILAFLNGMFDPIMKDYLHKHVESHHRSTVESLSSLVSEGLASAMAPFFGLVIDAYSLSAALLMSGGIMALNIFLLLGTYFLSKRK